MGDGPVDCGPLLTLPRGRSSPVQGAGGSVVVLEKGSHTRTEPRRLDREVGCPPASMERADARDADSLPTVPEHRRYGSGGGSRWV